MHSVWAQLNAMSEDLSAIAGEEDEVEAISGRQQKKQYVETRVYYKQSVFMRRSSKLVRSRKGKSFVVHIKIW